MINRTKLKEDFLNTNNIYNYHSITFPQDASKRSYERIIHNDSKYVLMDAPPEFENVQPFIKVTDILHGMQLSAPKIFAEDQKNGFLLLEDFDDYSYNKYLSKNPHEEEKLYINAIAVLVHIYKNFTQHKNFSDYSYKIFLQEASIFSEHCMEKDRREKYIQYMTYLYNQLPKNMPKTLVLRDYHADNLHILHNKEGIGSVGLLDYQDALIGCVSYDIMSLIEDARRDVNPALVNILIDYYIAELNLDKKDFLKSYQIWALQRNLKIIGIFTRKSVLEGNDNYQKYIPRVYRYLESNPYYDNSIFAEACKLC